VLIVDTGPLVAAADTADRHHARYSDLLETDAGPFVTTAMVVAETAYLLDRQLGAKAEVALYNLVLEGTLRVEPSERNPVGNGRPDPPHGRPPSPSRSVRAGRATRLS
jgi:predicted nucleic acid-binding protein